MDSPGEPGCMFRFGTQPAGHTHIRKRTEARGAACEGTYKRPRVADLRAAKLRPAAPFRAQFKIQYSKLKEVFGHAWACISTRAAACGGRARLQGVAGLRRWEAAARRSLRDRFCLRPARSCRFSPSYFAAYSTAQQSAARNRPRAEGCIFASRRSARASPPLGCGLVLRHKSTAKEAEPPPARC